MAASALCIAGALVAAGAIIRENYDGLRAGGLPWGLAILAAGIAGVVHTLRDAGYGAPRSLARRSSVVVEGVAWSGCGFLGAIAILNLFGSQVLRRSESGPSIIGTLIASIATIIVLPVALLLFGIALARDGAAPARPRFLPLGLLAVFLTGPLTIALVPDSAERAVTLPWVLALGLGWAAASARTPPTDATQRGGEGATGQGAADRALGESFGSHDGGDHPHGIGDRGVGESVPIPVAPDSVPVRPRERDDETRR
jgi:hypothetical protein